MNDDELSRIIRAELVGTAKLLKAAIRLREALKSAPDMARINTVTHDIDVLMAEMSLCERHKRELLAKTDCRDLQEVVYRGSDVHVRIATRKQLQRLAELLLELRQVADENKTLLRRNEDYLEYSLNVLAQVQAGPSYGDDRNIQNVKLLDASV